MTPQQEAHLAEVKKSIGDSLDEKYRKGQAEHGGNVWERPLLPEIDGEITDLIVYWKSLKKKVAFAQEGIALVKQAIQRGKMADALDILDIVDSNLRDL